jgi:hypothetical protein
MPIPIEDELLKPVKLLPFTPETKLFAMVTLLVAVPVPTVMPRPPHPPVLVVTTLVIIFFVTDEETNPVSKEIPTGDPLLVVSTLIVLPAILLLRLFPTCIPKAATVVLMAIVLFETIKLSNPPALTAAVPFA